MLALLRRKWLLVLMGVVAIFVISRPRSRGPAIQPGSFLLAELEGEYVEGPPQPLLARLLDKHESYVDLADSLRKAAVDQRIAGVIVRIGPVEAGWAQAREIREALKTI